MNNRGRGFSTNGESVRPRGGRRRNRGHRNRARKDVTTAVPDSDEIFYDERTFETQYCGLWSQQNFDYAGFLVLVEETYDCLLDMDCYFERDMPFSVFQHVMVNLLNLQILTIASSNGCLDAFPGNQPEFSAHRARNLCINHSCIPKPIADYISHVSDTVSRQGITVKLNLPKIAVPQGPIGDIPSGTFGVINEHTHNVYECYISPLVTANRVIASVKNTPDYQPLPSAIISSDLIPNKNLLGYGPIDKLSAYTPNYLLNLDFPDNDTIEGRLKICSSLVQHVHHTMARMRNKMKMVQNCGEIIPKSALSNLCFVESCGTRNTSIVSRMDVLVHSYDKFSAITANQASLECMHRRRVDNAVGSCYTAADGSVPAGWAATCNSNFEMDGVFAPDPYPDYPEHRFKRFVSYAAAATRIDVYKNFIAENYFI